MVLRPGTSGSARWLSGGGIDGIGAVTEHAVVVEMQPCDRTEGPAMAFPGFNGFCFSQSDAGSSRHIFVTFPPEVSVYTSKLF